MGSPWRGAGEAPYMRPWRARAGCAGICLALAGLWLIVGVATGGDRWGSFDGVLALAVWLTGLTVVAVAAGRPAHQHVPDPEPERPHAQLSLAAVGIALVAVGLLLARGADWDSGAAAICWLIAIAALLTAAAEPRFARPRWPPRPSAHGWAALALIGLAGMVRLTELGSHPRIVDGDGAGFAVVARAVARGEITDPFATGYLDHPTLFAFVQWAAMALGGESLAGARSASAVAGTATVAVTYLLARRLAGSSMALTAAGVLAVLPVHVHFSRLALNNVFDSLTLVTALWLVARAIDECRTFDAAAAGVVVGMGQYFYFSARLVAVLVAVFALWRGIEAADGDRPRRMMGRVGRLWVWMAAGAVVAYVPLALQYLRYPATFNPRATQVMLIGDGDVARQARLGSSLGAVLVENIGQSLISPFGAAGLSTFHPPPPTIGWTFAVPLAVGIAWCTVHARRSDTGVVALVWWAAMVAVGVTVGYPVTRWVFATPIVALAIAHGLHLGWRLLETAVAVRSPAFARRVRVAVAAIGAVAIATTALVSEFTGPTLPRYGDANSLVATRLASELARQPPGTEVFALMLPRMRLDGHHLEGLAAPHIVGVDLVEALAEPADVPAISGRSGFVFLPERRSELDIVRARFPGGTEATRSDEGLELYTVYRVAP
jgi:4-amino-4-deoxy-L-arabinose transferase-like glycosyltransferase